MSHPQPLRVIYKPVNQSSSIEKAVHLEAVSHAFLEIFRPNIPETVSALEEDPQYLHRGFGTRLTAHDCQYSESWDGGSRAKSCCQPGISPSSAELTISALTSQPNSSASSSS